MDNNDKKLELPLRSVIYESEEMTMLDYFAAHALQGAIAHGLFNADKASKDYAEFLAIISYQYAEAMMEYRESLAYTNYVNGKKGDSKDGSTLA
jgi:hypothetical protein